MSYIFGKKAILDNLDNPNISIVYLSKNTKSMIGILKEKNIKYKIKEDSFFKKIGANVNHQFCVGEILEPHSNTALDLEQYLLNLDQNHKHCVLILDEIQDPGNFGAIIRSAAAFGVDCIIYKKNNQVQVNETVIKTSVGAITKVNLLKVTNLSNAIEKLKTKNFWTVASCLERATNLHEMKFDFNVALIVGNENAGISQNLLNNADFKVKIKMTDAIQSLNVASATSILLNKIYLDLIK